MQQRIKYQIVREEIDKKIKRLIEESHIVLKKFIDGKAGPDEKVLASQFGSSILIELKVSDLEIIAQSLYDSHLYLVRIIPNNNSVRFYSTNAPE